MQLPPDSRCVQKDEPDAAWSTETMMLRLIEFEMRGLMYALGGGKGDKPNPIELPSEQMNKQKMLDEAEQVRSEIDEVLKGIVPIRKEG